MKGYMILGVTAIADTARITKSEHAKKVSIVVVGSTRRLLSYVGGEVA
jgi:hypothetical protein